MQRTLANCIWAGDLVNRIRKVELERACSPNKVVLVETSLLPVEFGSAAFDYGDHVHKPSCHALSLSRGIDCFCKL